MESVLESLSNLAKSSRLVSTEQVLMSSIFLLDEFLTSSLSDEQFQKIENTIFDLFSVNKSNFSVQCSLYIASKLLKLYKAKKNKQIYNIINLAITKPSAPTIMCAGYICRYIGHKCKAQLPRFMDFLLKQKSDLEFASIYSLRCCFKAASSNLTSYIKPSIDYVRKFLQLYSVQQLVVVISIKFLKEIVKNPETPIQQVLDLAKYIFSSQQFPLLHDEIANLVARAAFSPLYSKLNKKMKEKTEWAISNYQDSSSELDEPLETIKKFGRVEKNILRHFLNMLTTTLSARNSVPLFNYLRKNCPQLLSHLVPLMPADTKFNLFSEISKGEKMTAEQLQLMILLCPDSKSINEAAAVALLLAFSEEKSAKNSSKEFFASFSKSHPVVTLSYLRTSLVFLAHPPEVNRNIENEIHGNASIAFTILSNIPRLEDAILPNKSILKQFIDDVFTPPIQVSSSRFSDAFKLLSIIPEKFTTDNPKVTDAVLAAVDFLMASEHNKKWKKLLKNVLEFRTKFIETAQNNLLVVAALSSNETLSNPILISLEKLVPLSSNIEGWAYDTVKRIINSSQKIKPTQSLVKKFIFRPLPTGNDLLKYKDIGMRQEKKSQDQLEKLLINFPSLFNSCQLNEKTELIKTLVNSSNSVCFLFVLELFRQIPHKMPKRAYTVLLQKLKSSSNDKNLMITEIVCETIALYYKFDNSILPVVFDYIEKNASHGCCILLSAIFSHAEIGNSYIARSTIILNSYMKTGSAVPFALHAINSMLLKHSMQLANSGITLNEFSVLFDTLNSKIALQPVVLHLCSEMFSLLIEVNSSNIQALENFVNISLQAIKFTPIEYSKEAYLNSVTSVVTFCHSLVKYAPISFPSSVCTSTSAELIACSAFTNYIKFDIKLDLNLSKTMKKLLDLLQKTNDDRASQFIIALASKYPDLDYWISAIRRILLVDSVFDNNAAKIEPNSTVKVTFLEVCASILPLLATEFNLKTEYLDDVISAICKSISTDRVKVQEAAFPVLKKLIELFRNRRSENGGRLLDLYDVQFVLAVKTGFTVNLTASGCFLSTYLSFHTANISDEMFNKDILDVYVEGLQNCEQRSSDYYSLVLSLCIVAQKFEKIAESFQPFLESVVPIFADAVLQSMKIKENNWRRMAKFRNLVSSFYEDLPASFVWLQKLTNNIQIDANVLVSFFITEIMLSKEPWKKSGAMNAIPVLFKFFGGQIKPELVNEAIKIISQSTEKELVYQILKTSANLIPELNNQIKNENVEDAFDELKCNILSLAMNADMFIPEIFAHLLFKDRNGKLNQYSVAIGIHFIIQLQKGFDTARIIPLFQLLFNHSPNVIGVILNVVLTKLDSRFDEFKIKLMTIGLSMKNVDHIPLNTIGRFAVQSFESTGLQMLSTILVNNPEIGIAILSQNVLKVAFLLAANDGQNCRFYLRFIHLCLDCIIKTFVDKTNPNMNENTNNSLNNGKEIVSKVVNSVIELLFTVIRNFGNNPQNGSQVVTECVNILKLIRNQFISEFEEQFNNTELSERVEIMEMLKKHISKAVLRNKNSHLTVFSGNARTTRYEDEWQTLTVGDSSDED
ncbi:hypothetical protein TRFO_23216 [Tritrichomonas foetus]|uniref:Uncharacterized protein n=1 Tax=Tritrichomonas foetus TaxID=1144522 RepID=A0A1J4KF29_9EUKA|nr:hypothetical protein TRFO_23216 [Tritrichomonas foetus]|eukprot:OHT08372.1 hypothetical protein TRFO_23216 [Tritrichomonas foetus]